MTFPQTDLTLVQLLAAGGSEEDWRRFLHDYWGAICRFALRWGARGLEDAEDATAQTFEAIWENPLLVRWVSNRSSKLRTLLCRVVRNVLSQRHRVPANRDRLWPEIAEHLEDAGKTKGDSEDTFYAAWVESVIQQAIESLAGEYGRKGQGDYVCVLYGRICRGLTLAQTAEVLGITPANVDHYFRHARDRLQGSLKQLHRLIVTSRTYQQSSRTRSDATVIDADNRLLWRQNPLRLDADAYRDPILAVSGRIGFAMGGPAIQHFQQSPGPQLTPKLDYAAYAWSSPGADRRSIYRCVWRGILDPLMAALDFPDLGLLAPTRGFSASPLQALALYNNDFILVHSEAMARRISEQNGDLEQQVRQVTQLAYNRDPSESEREQFRSYVMQHGLAALCRVILNSNEFLFVP